MNRKGFRLPQATPWLLAGVAAVCATQAAPVVYAAEAAEPVTPPPIQQTAQQPSQQDESPTEQDQERSVVYSLRDYERTETTATSPEEYLNDYPAQDGIQRSLAGPDVVITAGTERTVY